MLQEVSAFLAASGKDRGNLIPILQRIQARYAYLSEEALLMVAGHLGIAPCEAYGVASFYNQFRFHPPGRHQIKVCLGTACHVRGGDVILESFERKLGIHAGETTPDREYSIDRVACVGCCALAPVGIFDETVHGRMVPSKVEGLVLGVQIRKQQEQREKAGGGPKPS